MYVIKNLIIIGDWMPWQSLPPVHVDGAVKTASLKHIYLCNIAIVDPHILTLMHKSRECTGHGDLGDPLCWIPCGSHMTSTWHLKRSLQAGPTWAYVSFCGMQNDTFGLSVFLDACNVRLFLDLDDWWEGHRRENHDSTGYGRQCDEFVTPLPLLQDMDDCWWVSHGPWSRSPQLNAISLFFWEL